MNTGIHKRSITSVGQMTIQREQGRNFYLNSNQSQNKGYQNSPKTYHNTSQQIITQFDSTYEQQPQFLRERTNDLNLTQARQEISYHKNFCSIHPNQPLQFVNNQTLQLICVYCALKSKQDNSKSQVFSLEEKIQSFQNQYKKNQLFLREKINLLDKFKIESVKLQDQQIKVIEKHYETLIAYLIQKKQLMTDKIYKNNRKNQEQLTQIESTIQQIQRKHQDFDVILDRLEKLDEESIHNQLILIRDEFDNFTKKAQINDLEKIEVKKAVFVSKISNLENFLDQFEKAEGIVKSKLRLFEELQNSQQEEQEKNSLNEDSFNIVLQKVPIESSSCESNQEYNLSAFNSTLRYSQDLSCAVSEKNKLMNTQKILQDKYDQLSEDLKSALKNNVEDTFILSGREKQDETKDLSDLYTFNEKQLDKAMEQIEKTFEYHSQLFSKR